MYSRVSSGGSRGGPGSGNGAGAVVKLDQVPCWSDVEQRSSVGDGLDDAAQRNFDPLSGSSGQKVSKFGIDHSINGKLYIWKGVPWNLEVDAVVNSTNEASLSFNLDEAHSSPGLHAAAGPGLAEECSSLGGCRTGMAKITSAYDLPARRVIHTVGPRYAVKYHTAAENALSHCYRSCLELLIEHDLESIAMGCIYSETKGYPREPAAHVAIRTVRRFMEKHGTKITGIVFCMTTSTDAEIYRRLLPLYFPRDKYEEDVASVKLPADVGDENGETIITERKIRISALPSSEWAPSSLENGINNYRAVAVKRNESLDALVDPAFMSMTKDPDQRRQEQWEKIAQAQGGWAWMKWMGLGSLNTAPLSLSEENAIHARYLARANVINLTEVAEMKIIYRAGVDADGKPVIVVVGAHFLLRCLDLERFILYVVKEFEPVIQRSYTIVYIHSAASLQAVPDLGWIKRIQQILGRRHKRNLNAIYVLHPTVGLKTAILALQLLVDQEVWKKVVYVERLLDLFQFVPRDQLTIPDFVFQHDLEVNGEKGLGADQKPRTIANRSRQIAAAAATGR
ncbi:hypothetical protein SELMODRAFT_91055 [Selaginella moellendorffii]|uniref:Macro domain-containing protein n=1 Tax=Selaginella moellendorffii TaxID=88036 RepID=D8RDF5_SELML|nr:hypothetical protein SELMODRAFT_91055 [Selaginella moellendorffii]